MNNTQPQTKPAEGTQSAHAYELAGMGCGPYSFCGIVEMLTPGDGSAASFANANPYAEVQSIGMKAGAGTCACCGMAIIVICVVRDGAGDKWGVGSDCIEKIGDPALCDSAKVAVAKRRNRMARARNDAKREAQRQIWLDSPSVDSRSLTGETNRQFIARLDAESKQAQEAQQRAQNDRAASFADVLSVLDAGTDFFQSLASQLRRGALTGRQAHFAAKCFPSSQRANIVERITA